ncbi:MAG TPA: hypothetical protein DDZ51_22470 [Planctomycetaceae bacterium]|nr:hypothetical protein [Planctomycetaceae bacterium]
MVWFSKAREYYYDPEMRIDSFDRCIQNLRNGGQTLPRLRSLVLEGAILEASPAENCVKMRRTSPKLSKKLDSHVVIH